MGFLTKLSSIGQKVKHYTRIGINKGRKAKNFIRKGIGHVNNFLDEVLDIAHNMPLLADLATEFENNDIYKNYRGIANEIDDILATSDVIFDKVGGYVGESGPSTTTHVPHPLNPQNEPAPPPYQQIPSLPPVGVTA